MNNTKLCSTLPIEKAPKTKFFDDYCLAIDDNYGEFSNENMDQKPKLLKKNIGTIHYYGCRHNFFN